MKFAVTFKDPDALEDQVREAVLGDVAALELSKEDSAAIFESRFERTQAAIAKWFKYGECVTIELDTDAGTATVVAT